MAADTAGQGAEDSASQIALGYSFGLRVVASGLRIGMFKVFGVR